MKCIFCLEEKEPSVEHIIPESIGGCLRMSKVCSECNSELSRLVDNPFANSPFIKLYRYMHSIGGKRGKIPFPFEGVGIMESGQKVSFDRDFKPHVKRTLDMQEDEERCLGVHFGADLSDIDDFDRMLGRPLRKAIEAHYPDWTSEQIDGAVSKAVDQACAMPPVTESETTIKQQWTISLNDLLFEFLKIAYEIWFLRFSYPWVENSETAKMIRKAILSVDPNLPIRGKLFCQDIPLPVSDPFKNHLIYQSHGGCTIRLFNITCVVECEQFDERFMLSQEDSRIIIQDFLTGDVVDKSVSDFLVEDLPES